MTKVKTHELTLLEKLLDDFQVKTGLLDKGEAFELLAVEQILKDENLSISDLKDGIVDGGDDGGLDAVYLFVNGFLVSDPEELEDFDFPENENPRIRLVLVQAKSQGFSENIIKITKTTDPPPVSWSTLIVSLGGSSYGYQTTQTRRDCYEVTPG